MTYAHNDSRVWEIAAQVAKGISRKVSRTLKAALVLATRVQLFVQFRDQIGGSTFVQITYFPVEYLNFGMHRQPIHNERRGALGVSQNSKIQERTHVALQFAFLAYQRLEWWTIFVPVLALLLYFLLLAIVVVVDDERLGCLFVTFPFSIARLLFLSLPSSSPT
jgi:hypothetical protein